MKIERFEDIESWQKARVLVNRIYGLNSPDYIKDFGLKDQLRRASVSIMSNIAEGFDSGSNKSFINFLNYSYRSVSEVQSLLYISSDLKYIDTDEFNELIGLTNDIKNLIGGFIQYLKKY
ncbi:MAG: four helix bundle protein [Bacteroidetes bacterium]|nr:four helix bundle protein [Bacteroidota bacterium]MBU1678140.1 four helix bundle protein [Bacteroidota bacterium]MBU2508023.1 four helix bundle protein [Bacteroidota bacterium]